MLTDFEKAHAESILDEYPRLEPIPLERRDKILIASVVRKPPQVVEALCKTLSWQKLREQADIDILFAPNYAPSDPDTPRSLELLAATGTCWQNFSNPGNDYGHTERTRHWQPSAWHRVGAIKDQIITYAKHCHYDYLLLVDADVLCDPSTLQSLIDTDKPIVSAVYWTFWQRHQESDAQKQHCGPQVWLVHSYQLHGRGKSEAEFRRELVERKLTEVWGLGACTLIRKDAIDKGVAFARVGDLPPGPMSDGEDRHFCHRAMALHIRMFADPWPDVWHAYHPQEYDDIPKRLDQLAAAHKERPELGDLVSLKISSLEPVRTTRGWMVPETQYVRGRFGLLDVPPEIEERLTSMKVGDRALTHVHYPVHYDAPEVRGQRRSHQVELLDCKPFRYAPTIEEELLIGLSGRFIDPTVHTDENLASLLERAHVQ